MAWRRRGVLGIAGLGALAAGGWSLRPRQRLGADAFAARYATPLPAPERALSVYHLGHSLVGRDMPAMLAQLAAAAGYPAHHHASQLGWGASLRQHWEPDAPVPGFAVENAHPAHRDAFGALASGAYDAVVLTEMVDLRDAIRWHDSAHYLAQWARAAHAGNPDVRVYLYETWHRQDDPEGWLTRIARDLPRHWEDDLLRPAMAEAGVGTIHVIPAGQALAAVVRAAEAGQLPGIHARHDLFALTPEGTADPIHLGDLGAAVVAYAHFAALYHRSPEGLPAALRRADGSAATRLPEASLSAVQRLVWQAVSTYPASGIAPVAGA